jgi:GNAT superfamily N-acetyltransferase
MKYAVESLPDIKSELEPLLELHWHEIALNQDSIKLDPDWNTYLSMYRNRTAEFVTARTEGGHLVGYAVWFIKYHLHYKSTLWAYNDIIYLKPEYRKGRAGIGLIKASEEYMRILGVKKVQWHIKVSNDWSKILERFGYMNEETVMGKVM